MLLKSAKKHKQYRKYQYLVQSYRYVEVPENIDIEDVDYTYKVFIKEHNRSFQKYAVQCQFKFHFDKCLPGIFSALFNNDTVCDWKDFLLKVISDFNDKGYKFSHFSRRHIITHNLKKDMTYYFYMNTPMSAVERKINITLNKNPDLINLFDRTIDYPMNRKFNFVPF